ncbi:MAG: Phage shock protein C [Candidatus Daviesbacteria bacterium GW2011_GWA1_41_61]|uniref:Phage shock protein C n=1 Tax=Candidatus Daviesbacteria bacterium GW2011_GWA2_40_9 TaxID=1618424 RepID=A0A0G0U4M8_9BACT|nr:MAG: Phage shock protein C [Candidatus Daviesbacteria bacterium GW2011_GWA2_40_9]KKR93284.1 MAG: Phage shock protein C [Candidatus Daviesbacteria bacterium GW2011_GWB1_41_15]KKS14772.1 MAG: Phage shock protein C [Candidatus Daviesbacteria bacterium GW2011_GWA1_41_61]
MKTGKLYRSKNDRLMAGVFGGLGHYLNVDSTILRLAWVLITVFTGFVPGVIAYILAAVVIPPEEK